MSALVKPSVTMPTDLEDLATEHVKKKKDCPLPFQSLCFSIDMCLFSTFFS